MTGHHVRAVSKCVEGSLNGQVGREHGGLRVLGLLEFVLSFLQFLLGKGRAKDETGQGFSIEDLDHGFVGLIPHVLSGNKTMHQISGHADILTPLPGVEMSHFGLRRKGRLV